MQFEEEPMPATEVGESSSPPPPLILREETNEFADSDMYDNDDLISDTNSPIGPKWETNIIHATGELAENPNETRRTRSQF